MSETVKRKQGWFTPAVIVLGLIVAAFVLPIGVGVRYFRMPSGSMQPALFPGDTFLAAKWAYGYGRYSFAPLPGPSQRILAHAPQRGDVVVFRPPPDPDRDFVKRVVGLPGDRIQMIGGVLHINGQAVTLQDVGERTWSDGGMPIHAHAYRETLPNGVSYDVLDRTPQGELDNTRVFTVPDDSYFLLGDDRDNSADSRVPSVMGYVPFANFVGRVIWIGPTSPSRQSQDR